MTLILLHGILAWISGQFSYDNALSQRPLLLLSALLSAAGLVYLAAVWLHVQAQTSKKLFFWIVVAGLCFRLTMMVSHPMQEVDFYRYLWDGGVTAHGFNPYTYSPAKIISGHSREGRLVPKALIDLASQGLMQSA